MPFIYALGMIAVSCFIAGIACKKLETQRISRPVFVHDLAKWYMCKQYLTTGDAVKVCAFVFLFLLVLYAGPLIMTYFPQTNILHYRQQQLLGFLPTPAMINGHWATSISYYILAWPLSFIPLNIASKALFKHSHLASDLSIAIESHPVLSKLMTEKTPDAMIRRFHAEQVAPDYVILHHWAPIEFNIDFRPAKTRLANAGNLDISQMWEIRHGEIHLRLCKASLLTQDGNFTQRADGSLVRTESKRYTYFVRVGDTIKIGGGDDPYVRLDNCQTWVAAPEPLAYVEASVITETEARRLFEHHRLRYMNGKRVKGKEIFAYHPEIVKFVEEGIANGTFKRFEET